MKKIEMFKIDFIWTFFLYFVCTVVVNTVFAQALKYPEELQREWREDFRKFTVDHFEELMKPIMNQEEKKRLHEVIFDFRITDNNQTFNFYSFSDGQHEWITMPVSSLLFLKDLSFAAAWLSLNGYSTNTLLEYVLIMSQNGLKNWPLEKRFPADALGIPSTVKNDQRVLKRYNDILLGNILFIVGHELGHIKNNFEASNTNDMDYKRQAERNADQFALDLFRRMKLTPVSVPLLFAIFSRLGVIQTTHPLNGERIRAAANFIGRHRDDFEKGWINPDKAPMELSTLIKEFDTLAELIDDPTLSSVQLDCALSYNPEDLLPRKTDILNIQPRQGEMFSNLPWSGVYQGTIITNKLDQSTTIRMIFRRNGNRLIGETQYLCFRGKLEGKIEDKKAVVRWIVGNIRRTITMLINDSGSGFHAKWHSDTNEGGDGTIKANRISQ